ncbi:unnamed protein product [Nezara viridula]|uniref:Uncharacterized protein n=1 Tax=Nezara viridula TaxID=85310 RepID=A0A9P0EGM7_NEZVI|nr:unnamed protein product [Nezara viridula]
MAAGLKTNHSNSSILEKYPNVSESRRSRTDPQSLEVGWTIRLPWTEPEN